MAKAKFEAQITTWWEGKLPKDMRSNVKIESAKRGTRLVQNWRNKEGQRSHEENLDDVWCSDIEHACEQRVK